MVHVSTFNVAANTAAAMNAKMSATEAQNRNDRRSSVWDDFSEQEQQAIFGLASLSSSRNSTPFSPLQSPNLISPGSNDVFCQLPEFSPHLAIHPAYQRSHMQKNILGDRFLHSQMHNHQRMPHHSHPGTLPHLTYMDPASTAHHPHQHHQHSFLHYPAFQMSNSAPTASHAVSPGLWGSMRPQLVPPQKPVASQSDRNKVNLVMSPSMIFSELVVVV